MSCSYAWRKSVRKRKRECEFERLINSSKKGE